MTEQEQLIIGIYEHALSTVVGAGFEWEVDHVRSLSFEALDESRFLSEFTWVVFNSGMRESVISAKWRDLTVAFSGFLSAQLMLDDEAFGREMMTRIFNNKRKIDAVYSMARRVKNEGWEAIHQRIETKGVGYLRCFPMIGPVTCFHLARNLGMDAVKPDRHLVRMSGTLGCRDPLEMCSVVAEHTGERIGVVDVVLWRWATVAPNYIELMTGGKDGRSSGCEVACDGAG